jgi:protein tyrosine/serine phosphatase
MKSYPLPIPESYWVLPGRFLAGEYPGGFGAERVRRRVDAFLKAGINTFIDLTGPDELPSYLPILTEKAEAHKQQVETINLPIRDFGLPTRAEMVIILDTIDAALAKGRNVYLHCWGGIGRTGTTVGCYLVRHGLTGEQALARIAEWWQVDPRRTYYPRSPETDEQVKFVREWHELA